MNEMQYDGLIPLIQKGTLSTSSLVGHYERRLMIGTDIGLVVLAREAADEAAQVELERRRVEEEAAHMEAMYREAADMFAKEAARYPSCPHVYLMY